MLRLRTAPPRRGSVSVVTHCRQCSSSGSIGACVSKQSLPLAVQPELKHMQPGRLQGRLAHYVLERRRTPCCCKSSSSRAALAVHLSTAPAAPAQDTRLRAVLSAILFTLALGALAAVMPGSVSASPAGSGGGQFSLGAACQGAQCPDALPDFAAYRAQAPWLRLPMAASGLLSFMLHLDVHLKEIIAQHGKATYGILFAIVFCETGLVLTPFLPGAPPRRARHIIVCELHSDQRAANLLILCWHAGRQATPCSLRRARLLRWGPCGCPGCWQPSSCLCGLRSSPRALAFWHMHGCRHYLPHATRQA